MKRRSEASSAAAAHWSKVGEKKRSVEKEVVEKKNEEEKTGEREDKNYTKPSTTDRKQSHNSPIRLFYSPSCDPNDNQDTVMLSELIGIGSLVETFQFNFTIDVRLFLSYLHPQFSSQRRKVTFVTGTPLYDQQEWGPDLDKLFGKFNITQVVADLPVRYGTHHSKMMVNFYDDDSCEVIIMTCNITKLDFGGLTQMCWRSERLYKEKPGQGSASIRGNRFKRDLINYIKAYKKRPLNELCERLKQYDFLKVNVDLVASFPGDYRLGNVGDDDELYGYGKLYQVLKRNGCLLDNTDAKKHYRVLSQVSSIAYPLTVKKTETSSVFTHLLCPLIFSLNSKKKIPLIEPGTKNATSHQLSHNYTPQIVYPSVEDVAANNVGFGAGQLIHFNYSTTKKHKDHYQQNINPYLYRWRPNGAKTTGREYTPPHVKLYMCDNGDNWQSIKWIMMGSHNLSKQAWGGGKGFRYWDNTDTYEVSSYELGVFVTPESSSNGGNTPPNGCKLLVPSYKCDSIELSTSLSTSLAPSNTPSLTKLPVRLPLQLPPAKYSSSDKPWSALVNFGSSIKDKFGQCYNGLDS